MWANLCDEHNDRLTAAKDSLDPNALLACWALAQGGAKKFAERMMR